MLGLVGVPSSATRPSKSRRVQRELEAPMPYQQIVRRRSPVRPHRVFLRLVPAFYLLVLGEGRGSRWALHSKDGSLPFKLASCYDPSKAGRNWWSNICNFGSYHCTLHSVLNLWFSAESMTLLV